MLGVYVGGGSAKSLSFRHDVVAQRGFPCRFRSEYLDDPPPWDSSDPQGQIQRDGASRDCLHLHALGCFPQPHDCPSAELPFNLA